MAEYALVEAPAWDTVYASQNGDGTSTFWANSFLPMWGRLSALAEYLEYDETMLGTTLKGSEYVTTAPFTLSGASAGIRYREPGLLPDSDTTVALTTDHYFVDTLSAARTYTLPPPDAVGQTLTITLTSAGGFTANIQRQGDGSPCASILGASGTGFVKLIAGTGPTWRPVEFGGYAFVDTYP